MTVAVSVLVFGTTTTSHDPFGGAWGVSSAPFERIKFTSAAVVTELDGASRR